VRAAVRGREAVATGRAVEARSGHTSNSLHHKQHLEGGLCGQLYDALHSDAGFCCQVTDGLQLRVGSMRSHTSIAVRHAGRCCEPQCLAPCVNTPAP
jgi:hypothetical protein